MEIVIPIVILISIIIAIVNAVSRPSVTTYQQPLRPSLRDFQQLGDIRGKSLKEVIDAAGLPNSYSNSGPYKLLVQWIAPGIHLALLFEYRGPKDGDWGNVDAHRQEFICLGITHQFGG